MLKKCKIILDANDYIADTLDLSLEEHGIYFLLLALCARQPTLSFPDDRTLIRRSLPALRSCKFKAATEKILERFFVLKDGRYSNEALSKVLLADQRRNENGKKTRFKRPLQMNDINDLAEISPLAKKNRKKNVVFEHTKTSDINELAKISPLAKNLTTTNIYKKDSYIDSSSKQEDNGVLTKRRATRLPPDWKPTEADIAMALEEGFSGEMLNREIARFRDYWDAKAGQNATKVNWSATFRNWIRGAFDRRPLSYANGGRNGKSNIMDTINGYIDRYSAVEPGSRPTGENPIELLPNSRLK